jgi:hypothetical protein
MDLTERDIEKLEKIREFVEAGTACTGAKKEVLACLESILEPKCAVCRGPIEGEMVVVNQRKLHPGCEKKYKK